MAGDMTFTGQLDGSQTFVKPALSSFAGDVTTFTAGASDGPDSDTRSYFSQPLYVGTSGFYAVEVSSARLANNPAHAPEGDTVIFIYESSFDPNNPLNNIVIANDDIVNNAQYLSRINDAALEQAIKYIIVATSSNAGATGTLGLTINGPGDISLTPTAPSSEEGVIDTRKPFFTEEDSEASGTLITFDGGTLKPETALTVGRAVYVQTVGGSLDTNGTTLTLTGQITGTGQLVVTGGGQVILDGASENEGGYAVENGILRVNGSATGPVMVRTNGVLRGVGRISGATRVIGTLAPGNSPGTMAFAAPVTLSPTAVLSVDIDGTGTGNGAGNYSRIILTGRASVFTADGRLTPVLRGITGSASNTFTPAVGQSFTVVLAEGGVQGHFDVIDQPAVGLPAGSRFEAIYGAQTIRLVVTSASVIAPTSGLTKNQQAVRDAVDAGRPDAGANPGGTAVLYDSLDALSADRLPGAFDQLSGKVHADAMTADLNNRRALGKATATRLEQRRTSRHRQAAAIAAGDGQERGAGTPTPSWQMWGQTLVGRTHNRGDGNASGFVQTTGAVFASADTQPTPDVTIGFGLGYANGTLDGRGGSGEARVNSYQLSAYGQVEAGPAFVEGAVGYGYSAYDTSRAITLGSVRRTAEGEADGHDLFADISVGYRFNLGDLTIEPKAGLRYDRLHRDGFTETGADDLALDVLDRSADALQSSLGAKASRIFRVGDTMVEPEVRLAWTRELLDETAESRLALNGARFDVDGAKTGRDAAVIGFGLSATQGDNLKVMIGSDAQIRREETGFLAFLGARLSW